MQHKQLNFQGIAIMMCHLMQSYDAAASYESKD
jgi:hypothetical protein